MATILIAGCGYVGTVLGQRLAGEGHVVWGLRRHAENLPDGIGRISADLTDIATLEDFPKAFDVVFYTAAAGGHRESDYRAAYVDGPRNLISALRSQASMPSHIFFTSSTAVYAQSQGEWVDESSPTEPEHFTGKRLLEGERLFLDSGIPATIVRLGGIYGPGRTRLIDSVRTGAAMRFAGAPCYTNRIHRDDAAGALAHLMALPTLETLYIGVDREPADQNAVLSWLADQLGVPQPPYATTPIRSIRGDRGNKRCLSRKLQATGYSFRYPTFREGYADYFALYK